MRHLDEMVIEMLVLGAPGTARRRAGIGAHLRVCHGCRDLYTEISAFYAELEAELSRGRFAGTVGATRENISP